MACFVFQTANYINRPATLKWVCFSRCGVAMLKVCNHPRRDEPPGVVEFIDTITREYAFVVVIKEAVQNDV